MDPDIIKEAMAEAERFLNIADKLQQAVIERGEAVLYGSKESASLRRSSLDLTRALAELRNRKVIEVP